MALRIYSLSLFLAVSFQALLSQSQPRLDDHLSKLQRSSEQALDRGDSVAAIEIIESGLKLSPEWKEGLWTLGWIQFQAKQYESARATFVKLVRLDQSKGASWLLLGLCEFQGRDYGMALDDLLRGRSLGIPESLGITSQVRYSTAVALLLAERYDRALQFFEEAARENEHTEEILLAWGLTAMRMPVEPQRAQDLFSATELTMLRSVGEAMFRASSHEFDEMKKIYSNLFQRYPSTAKLHHSYGFLLLRLGELDAAESEFRSELMVDPDSVLARLGLGHVALERGQAADAIRLAREATSIKPDSASAHLLLGKAQLAGGQSGEAMAALERARDLEPANAQVHFLLGRAYGGVKRNADAARERAEFMRLKQMSDALKMPGQQIPVSDAGESRKTSEAKELWER